MAQRILAQAKPVTTELDKLIFQMEVTLGKQHVPSPFPALYQKYTPTQTIAAASMSTSQKDAESKPEATKKAEEPAQKEEKKAKASAGEGEQKQEQKPKKEKKEKKPRQPAPAKEAEPQVDPVWDAFRKCDVRVAKIVECTRHPDSEKLYIEKIDCGEADGKIRTIGSGLQTFVDIEEMTQGLCLVFANLKPRKLADIMSEGMVLCAGNDDHTVVQIMRPPEGCKVGERVQLEGNPILDAPVASEYEPVLNPKKKFDRAFLEHLKTNDNCEGTYNGVRLMTSQGPVTCTSLKNVSVS